MSIDVVVRMKNETAVLCYIVNLYVSKVDDGINNTRNDIYIFYNYNYFYTNYFE